MRCSEDHRPKYIADIFLGHIDVEALLQQHDDAIVLEAVLLGGELPVYPQEKNRRAPSSSSRRLRTS